MEQCSTRRNRNKLEKTQQINIKNYSLMLKNGEISVGVFLATMANRKNNIVYADEIISLNEREVQLAQESESYGGHDDVDHEEFAEFSDSDTETIFSGEDLPEPSITQLRTRKNAETSESTAGRSLSF